MVHDDMKIDKLLKEQYWIDHGIRSIKDNVFIRDYYDPYKQYHKVLDLYKVDSFSTIYFVQALMYFDAFRCSVMVQRLGDFHHPYDNLTYNVCFIMCDHVFVHLDYCNRPLKLKNERRPVNVTGWVFDVGL